MEILIREAIAWYNLPLTILLAVVLVYWIFVSIGVFSAESFDLDIDVDADVDLDADIDMDADLDLDADGDFDVEHADHDFHAEAGGLGMVVLRFLNFGHVPAMIVVSILIAVLWVVSIFGNFLLRGLGTTVAATIVFFGGFILSALITKVLTMPLKKLFRTMKVEGEKKTALIGRTCVIRSAVADHRRGRAEVQSDGVKFDIRVRTSEGREPLSKNATALVVDFDEETDRFLIKDLTN